MADITLRVEASGENLARVTAELLELLAAAAVDARYPRISAPDGAKSGIGLTIGELELSATSAPAAASVLVSWLERTRRKVTLTSGDQKFVVDGTRAQDAVEKWLTERG